MESEFAHVEQKILLSSIVVCTLPRADARLTARHDMPFANRASREPRVSARRLAVSRVSSGCIPSIFLAVVAMCAPDGVDAAFAFQPPSSCSVPVLGSYTGGAAYMLMNGYSHTFDSEKLFVYVRADVTTPSAFSGYKDIFVWGAPSKCDGGLFAGVNGNNLFLGVQCNKNSASPTYATTLQVGTRYEVEFYYERSTKRVRMWVDGTEVTASGGETVADPGYNFVEGYISVGYGAHDSTGNEPFGGTVHEISFYECYPANTYGAAVQLHAAVNDCLSALDPTGATCDMHTWDVSRMTDVSGLFKDRTEFNADVSAWDMSSVTNADEMFRNASAFDRDITRWTFAASSQSSAMFRDADAWLALHANCGFDPDVASACVDRGTFETRPTLGSSAGVDHGPPNAWRRKHACSDTIARGFTRSPDGQSPWPCADEGEGCECPGGRVFFGQTFAADGSVGSTGNARATFETMMGRTHRVAETSAGSSSVDCVAGSFAGGDFAVGDAKRCWCKPGPTTCGALCDAGGAIPGACACPPMCADYDDTTAASKLSASCVARLYLDAGCTKDGTIWTNWDAFRTYGNYWRKDASDGGVGTLANVKTDFATYAAATSGDQYLKCRGS